MIRIMNVLVVLSRLEPGEESMQKTVASVIVTIVISTGIATAQTASDWPTFGGQPGGAQYSALDQIDTQNVGRLTVAWTHHSGDASWLEATPIHANDSLYYCTAMNRVIAIDPVTGEEKWRFDPHTDEGGLGLIEDARRDARCRSVAYWESKSPRPGVACDHTIHANDSL